MVMMVVKGKREWGVGGYGNTSRRPPQQQGTHSWCCCMCSSHEACWAAKLDASPHAPVI